MVRIHARQPTLILPVEPLPETIGEGAKTFPEGVPNFKRPRNESGIVDRYPGQRLRRYRSHFSTADLLTILTAQKFLICAYISIIVEI
jgi:hypothetical protein